MDNQQLIERTNRLVAQQGNYLNMSQLAKKLGIPHPRVVYFHQRLGLPATRRHHNLYRIWLSDFRAWAATHQKYLTDVPTDRLASVINDPSLIAQIHALPRRSRPVINLSTGKTYPNCSTAARDCYVSPSGLLTALKTGKTHCGGYQWQYADAH